nr:HD domain-containing protein [Nitrosopumilus sp.]
MIKSEQISVKIGSDISDFVLRSPQTTDKLINDPVHGHYQIPKYCCEFIDTEQFQRLRNLKQLGCCYYCFPGASHNRFEHCLGVSYLAEKFLRRIRKNQPELQITDRDIQCVRVAGLCHDIGHGPFSHCFEHWVRKYLPTFRHESMSTQIIKYIVGENNLEYSETEIKLISDLIMGNGEDYKEKRFLFD